MPPDNNCIFMVLPAQAYAYLNAKVNKFGSIMIRSTLLTMAIQICDGDWCNSINECSKKWK